MTPIPLGPGIAPDVTIVNGWIYVAFGTVPNALHLVTLTLDGKIINSRTLPNGFDQSFPRFSGPWLVYRQDEAHGFVATAYNVLTGQTWVYGPAGATYGLTVNHELLQMAYEPPVLPWRITLGSLATGWIDPTDMEGAPDGLDRMFPPTGDVSTSFPRVTLRKDTRGDVAGIWSPVYAGDLTVGMLRDEPGRPQGGIGVQLKGDILRVALPAENAPDPRCATDGTVYAIVCWSPVRLLLATPAALRALPPVTAIEKVPGPIVNKKEEPMPTLNLRAAVEAERAKYPALLTEDQPAKILNAVALAENERIGRDDWGLSAKPHGNHVPAPQGVLVAYDILHNRTPEPGHPHGRLFDALTDDLKGTVTWGEAVYHGDPVGRPWVAPVRVGSPAQPPAPPPVQPPATPAKTVAEIRAIRNELIRFYMDPDGLNRRARGQSEPIVFHDRGIEEWDAVALADGVEEAKRRIREFPEWKEQHRP